MANQYKQNIAETKSETARIRAIRKDFERELESRNLSTCRLITQGETAREVENT